MNKKELKASIEFERRQVLYQVPIRKELILLILDTLDYLIGKVKE